MSRELGVSEQTYYRWRREYREMRLEQARKLEELEKENGSFKKLVAHLTPHNAILKKVPRENHEPVREMVIQHEAAVSFDAMKTKEHRLVLSKLVL